MTDANARTQELLRASVHDLRSPLSQLRAFTDLLRGKYAELLPDDGKQVCEYIHAAAERGATVVERLEAYAQVLTPPVLQNVDLNSEFDSVAMSRDGASLERGDLGSVVADKAMLRSLLTELIDNALKFNRAERPEVRVERIGNRVSVIDNGIGIPEEFAERAFAPMKRLNGFEFPGAGMGLTICRRIIEAHNGSISIGKSESGGTKVEFELPPN